MHILDIICTKEYVEAACCLKILNIGQSSFLIFVIPILFCLHIVSFMLYSLKLKHALESHF